MTIYVDNLKFRRYGNNLWCHMMVDGDINELHEMASIIGLKRSWFQDHATHPHYDLTYGKRWQAIKHGAIAVSSVEMVKRCSKYGMQ